MSFSGLVKAYSVPSWRNTSYCSGVNWLFHSASVLITFLIPLDFELSPFTPSPFARGLARGLDGESIPVDFSSPARVPVCESIDAKGNLDSPTTAPSAIEDERKQRLFRSAS